MTRDPSRLATKTFDLVVVGGGIHGLFAARDAARRGRAVALVERDDFAAGLSFNHQRTVHGGLRALESGNVVKVLEQIRERQHWAQIAPSLLRPLPFLLPVLRGERPSATVLRAGLAVYNALGQARHEGISAELQLPPSRVVSREQALTIAPALDPERVVAAAVWHDYQTVFPERLNYLVALDAARAGACLVNYAEAVASLRHGGRFTGVRVRDRLTGDEFDVKGRATIIAAGPALGALYRALDLDDQAPPLVAAANLLVARPETSHAIVARGPSGRRLTAVPWTGRTLVGTFQSDATCSPRDPFPISVPAMLAEANAAFPHLALVPTDVSLVHRGLVPARLGDRVDLLPDSTLVHHRLRGVPGVTSVVGVKFTTARLTAREAVSAAFAEAGLATGGTPDEQPLPFATASNVAETIRRAREAGIDDEAARHLVDWYGAEADAVIREAAATGLAGKLADGSPVIEAEIPYACEHAAACRLSDAVLRRTRLGSTGNPGIAALERAAELMAERRGWSEEQRAAEIAHVLERYAI